MSGHVTYESSVNGHSCDYVTFCLHLHSCTQMDTHVHITYTDSVEYMEHTESSELTKWIWTIGNTWNIWNIWLSEYTQTNTISF